MGRDDSFAVRQRSVTAGATVEGRRLTLVVATLMVGVAATSFPTTVLVASLEKIRVDMHTDLAHDLVGSGRAEHRLRARHAVVRQAGRSLRA